MGGKMYSDVFCKVYNEFGWNYYPEIFGQQLLQWLKQQGVRPKSAMDLACGTGVLCGILQREGIRSEGMDLSGGMIAIARETYPGIRFEVADMTVYRPDRQYDLVTCTGDALNHIQKLTDIEKIFHNIYAYMAPGGWLIFDLLNENEVSDSQPFDMDFDGKTRVWFQMTRPEENRVNLKIKVYENGELRLEENICETIHPLSVICRMLEECGFIQVRSADRMLPENGPGTTWFVMAKKPELR